MNLLFNIPTETLNCLKFLQMFSDPFIFFLILSFKFFRFFFILSDYSGTFDASGLFQILPKFFKFFQKHGPYSRKK